MYLYVYYIYVCSYVLLLHTASVYVCIYIYIHIYIYIYTNTYTYIRININTYIYIYTYVQTHKCTKIVNNFTYFYVGMNHTMVTTTGVVDYPLYNISLGYVISFCHILIHVCSKFKWRALHSNTRRTNSS